VRLDPDRGTWRVRLGRASDRAGLAPLLEKLRASGASGIWIAEEPASEVTGVPLRLVDSDWSSFPTGATRLVALPQAGSRLEIAGKAYRGLLELRVDVQGRIRPVNWVEMESYLLGVVPAEMGPEVWPQLEALKAQAVAARTYAYANLGQFEEEGFDLCATPRCQVYGGAAVEHPLSDRAVQATRGEILTFGDKPIVALYTATCGGHTEDAAEIFPEQAAAYLKGVPCRAEPDAAGGARLLLEGRAIPSLLAETGEDVTREAALLAAAEIVPASLTPAAFAQAPDALELRRWTSALSKAVGRPDPAGAPTAPRDLAQAAVAVVRDLGLDERGRVLIDAADLPAILRDPAAAALPDGERRALGVLVSSGALRPLADGRLGLEPAPTRARLAAALARLGESYEAFGLREGSVRGRDGSRLLLSVGKGGLELPLGERPRLFASIGGRTVPATRLEVWPGDRVRFRTGGDGRLDWIEIRPPVKGTSDDRTAQVYSWEVRKTRRELEESINKRLAIGALRDLQVVRRGVSGRIVELRVVGSEASAVVKGFDVRNLLDLRESLTVVEILRDRSGAIEAVVFAGKGWGHGVGLCQVGAYGMAVRGKDHRAILGHYYGGARSTRVPEP
jgi:stage II sporulation protein D